VIRMLICHIGGATRSAPEMPRPPLEPFCLGWWPMTDLPPDFPRDLADMLGIKPERPALPGPAPITQAMRDALKAAHEMKGKYI